MNFFRKKCGELWGIVYLYTRKLILSKVNKIQFIGSSDAKADSKGRVFLPANFRHAMQNAGEESMVMRKDVFQDCLVIYPETIWKEQLATLRTKLSRWNRHEQQIFRQFAADAEILTADTNGRILLPRRYRELVGINMDVRFIGMDDTIEIWAREKVEVPFIAPEEFGTKLEELMETNQENTL